MNAPLVSESMVLHQLGERLAALRLAQNLTQAELAEQAGVSKRTVERLESGATATQLSTFLRVCRVLGLQGRLDQLVPEPAVSPVALLRQEKRQTRKRASNRQDVAAPPAKRWEWEA
ncbi:helix-turn-helix domain-containing protein [Luteimonas sp. XNQY3]|nr:helix-turn-helix transcriptional regulator [Luteimonas sp. XNQY3]MCD9008019.1 helix-turn-helix domain-containing protein [Luteimonas sp. XNQY3]